jgi:hypothetical protein
MAKKNSGRKDRTMAELLPNGPLDIYEKYADLPMREQAIVITALLDVALGELLVTRLRKCDREMVESLVGLERDSAPLKNLAARARMCRVLTVMQQAEFDALLELAKLRNAFAHRVEADILAPELNGILQKAAAALKVHALGFYKTRPEPGISLEEYARRYDAMATKAVTDAKEAEALFRLVAMVIYSFIYYHQKHCDPVFFAMLGHEQNELTEPDGTRVRIIRWKEGPTRT